MDALVAAPVDDLKRFALLETTVGDIPVTVDRGGFTGELGYEIYCARTASAAVAEAIAKAAGQFDAPRLTILEVYVRSLPMEKGMGNKTEHAF